MPRNSFNLLDRTFGRRIWLYVLVGFVGLSLSILLIVASFSGLSKISTSTNREHTVVTPGDPVEIERNKLIILNLLNRFNLDEKNVESAATLEDKKNLKMKHIEQIQNSLDSLETEIEIGPAQADLQNIFARWNYYIDSDKDTRELRNEFKTIAEKYPWLRAIVWILILNRL